jgi:hypothetical protein
MGWKVNSDGAAAAASSAAWQLRQQNFQALSKALQSNDLNAAKAAYASLTSNAPNNASSNPNSPLAQLDKALQNGDLASAQQVFSQMRGNHHRISAATNTHDVQAPAPPPPPPTDTAGNNVNVYV